MTPTPSRIRDRWVTAAIVAATSTVYLLTLMPGIGYSGDAAKWSLLGEVGGVPHPTGYPVYVALDQAFGVLMPWGSPAWRTNLLSAVFAVATVAVLDRLLLMLGVRWWVAAAAALTFAFTVTFWTHAVVAEVYTLHLLFLVASLACLARWRLGGPNAWLLAGLTLVALSFGNHLTTVLVLPGVAWLVWSDRRRAVTLANLAWVTLFVVLGASQYLYLLYMTDVGGYVESGVDDVGSIVRIVSGDRFQDQMFPWNPVEVVFGRGPLLLERLRDEYLVLLVPVVLGIWWGLRPTSPGSTSRGRRDVLMAVGLLGLGSTVYGMNFDVVDYWVFFLPLYLSLAVFLGVGLEAVVESTAARRPDDRRVAVATRMAVLAIPVVVGLVDLPRASQRDNVADARRIEHALATVPDDALLLTDNYADAEYYWYYQLAEARATDRGVTIVHAPSVADIEDYLAGNGARLLAVTGVPGFQGSSLDATVSLSSDAPRLRPLFTASPDQPWALAMAGLQLTEVADGLWRIDAPQ